MRRGKYAAGPRKKAVQETVRLLLQKFKCLYSVYNFLSAPVGEPSIISITNTSSTSVMIRWSHPPETQINGPLEGYRILLHRSAIEMHSCRKNIVSEEFNPAPSWITTRKEAT